VLAAAAVCPHPPLLVPEVAAGAAAETDDLRAACRAAVATLDGYDVVVVGGAPETRAYDGVPDFAAYGVGPPAANARPLALPLALAVGAWLAPGARTYGIAHDATPAEAAALGRTLAARDVALLVLGDGSARRDPKAPGYVDPRAEPYDAAVARALRDADPAALLALDPADDAALLAAGRAAWQVLAGAAGRDRFDGDLTYDAAPYGVGYLVATWSRA
jgi:aromatic ring-opening dioxygenase LigB subunit